MKIRRIFENFEPYGWEPSNEQIAREFNLNPRNVFRFDTNTSPYLPSDLLNEIRKSITELPINRYPDTSYSALRKGLASYNRYSPDSIMVANGADEALEIVMKTFVDDGSEVILSVPTYSYYPVLTRLMGGKVKQIRRRKDFSDDIDGIKKAITNNTSLVILCSPNNPTGNLVNPKTIEKILQISDCTVVVDEAYYEFCSKTLANLTSKYDNLIVARTFSKGFSLAGLRVGYTIASEKTTALLNNVRPPNSVGVISLKLAEIALSKIGLMRRNVSQMLKERDRCASTLSKLKRLSVVPTNANFMLVRFARQRGSEVYRKLAKRGLVVRDVSKLPGLQSYIRFSVGTPEENDKLLTAMKQLATAN